MGTLWAQLVVTCDTTTTAGAVTRSRPLCAYPQTAIYNGSGSTDDAANFCCGGNLESPAVVCDSLLVTYKHKVDGALDFSVVESPLGAVPGAERLALCSSRA